MGFSWEPSPGGCHKGPWPPQSLTATNSKVRGKKENLNSWGVEDRRSMDRAAESGLGPCLSWGAAKGRAARVDAG